MKAVDVSVYLNMQQLPTSISPYQNDFLCKLQMHKFSINGVFADYQIQLLGVRETDVHQVIAKTVDLFKQVCALYMDYQFKARLVALCVYERINNDGEVIGTETYHHTSYRSTWCSYLKAEEFYSEHMMKIASRIEEFQTNGSSLRFIGYKHIHIPISVVV